MKFIVELFSENPFDKDILLKLIEHNRGGDIAGQQKLVDDKKVDAGSDSDIVLATDKQKAYMKRLKIRFPENITKDQASKLISDKQEG